MADWKKVVLATGTNTQYIKGDGTFATYSTGLPLTGGTLTGNLKIDQGSASSNPRLTFAHDNIGTNHYIQMDRGADAMNIFVNGSNAIVIDSSQNATFAKHIILPNTYSLQWGDSNARIEGSTANDSISILTGGTSALTLDLSQDATFAGHIALASTKGIFFDGGSHTYIKESSILFFSIISLITSPRLFMSTDSLSMLI